nr:alpha/beta hydrolase [Bradyrhizobium sp. LTSPM299]
MLVHGGWHGAWCWSGVLQRLRSSGHRAFAPTLTGLADRSHLFGSDIGLDTHIADVVSTVRWEEMDGIVLCGHSYGGMVISGAAEQLEGKLAGIAFIDAFFPLDGQSCSDLSGRVVARDAAIPPPPAESFGIADADECARVARLMTPHPSNTVSDKIALSGARERVAKKAYIVAGNRERSYFQKPYETLSQDPAWQTFALPTGHHPMLDAPDALVDVLKGQFASA